MVKSSETLAILGNPKPTEWVVPPYPYSRPRRDDYVREIEASESELEKKKAINTQQCAELEALKLELEKEKAANTLLRSEIDASKSK